MPLEALPLNGFIEPGVACGFLYLTDSAIAFVESYASNPEKSSKERHEALEAVSVAIMAAAKAAGVARLVLFTADHGILHRATEWGFSAIGTLTGMSREV